MAVPTKTITFENGETRNDVPVDINSFEEYQAYKNSPYRLPSLEIERAPEPRTAEEYGAFGRDVKRVYRSTIGQGADFLESVAPLNAALNINKTAEDLYGKDFYDLDISDRMKRVREARAKYTDKSKIGALVNPTTEELNTIVDKDGYATPVETWRGTALNLGSYVAGGVGIYNNLRALAVNSPKAFRQLVNNNKITSNVAASIVTGTSLDQWMSNPNDPNLTAGLISIAKDFGVTDSTILGIGDYLTAKEDDSDAEKRVKMLLGNLPFEVLFGIGFSKFDTGLIPKDITKEDAVETAFQSLKRNKLETPTTQTTLSSGRVVDDAAEQAQVLNQEGGVSGNLKAMVNKFTQSRGFNTYSGQDAFEQSAQAARKYRNRAQHTAKRLQTSINNLFQQTDDKEIVSKVHEALTSTKVTIPAIDNTRSEEALVNFLKREFSFSDDVAKNVIEARRLVDEMSLDIRKYAPTRAAQKTIDENLNVYLNQSYRRYEDPDFVPSENAIAKAQQYFYKTFKEADDLRVAEATKKGKKARALSENQLRLKAIKATDNVVGAGSLKELSGMGLGSVSKIFKEKKDLAAPIREVLGEITDPEDMLTLTIDKMSKYYEKSRFINDMNTLGQKQKWLFNSIPEGLDGKLVKIEDARPEYRKINGKYTTPRMHKALMQEQVSLTGSTGNMNPYYANFLALKSFANRAATVYNWGTQVKNFMGAAFIGLANGTNPFRTGVLSKTLLDAPDYATDTNVHFGKSIKSIFNEISQGGDEALEELYEKYIGLGVINTNVRIGDFRALLEDGASSGSFAQLGNKLSERASKQLGRAGDLATKVYMASDDFFKINAFNNELDFIKRANQGSGRTLNSLEQEAADIVKNTVPNYDRVPPGIQALRNAPMGTFVSFPAEIIRTYFNIARQSLKELGRGLRGNAAYGARGALRASGLVGATMGFETLSEYMYTKSVGWTEDLFNAANELTVTPWSGKENTRIYKKDEETGQIFYTDTKFIDPYNTINAPIRAAINNYELGRLDEQGAMDAVVSSVGVALEKLLTPFVSPAIATQTVSDIYYAARSSTGETPEGTKVFNPNAEFLDKVADMSYYVLSDVIPKTTLGIDKLIRAADEERDAYTGEPRYDFKNELVSFASGIPWKEFDPELLLSRNITQYNDNMSEGKLKHVYPNFVESFDTFKDQYRDRQRKRYEHQKELYRSIQASQMFRSNIEIFNQLKDRNISIDDSSDLIYGRFIPEDISMELIDDISAQIGDAPKKRILIRKELSDVYADMSRTLLNTPDEED